MHPFIHRSPYLDVPITLRWDKCGPTAIFHCCRPQSLCSLSNQLFFLINMTDKWCSSCHTTVVSSDTLTSVQILCVEILWLPSKILLLNTEVSSHLNFLLFFYQMFRNFQFSPKMMAHHCLYRFLTACWTVFHPVQEASAVSLVVLFCLLDGFDSSESE